jgi:hypothetical protein
MFTRNIKNTFTANLLNAVSGVLGEANKKKCSEGCECEACVPEEETNENYVSHAQRKAVWANRADDGKGHPDKKKKMKEDAEVEEGYMPTNDMPSDKDRKTAGKLGALLKRERDAKEKKETNGVKTEDTDMPWAEDPNNPTRKVGERKDEYGNKVKNVAKHLAKKAMKANEEVEDLDEKRGLWDNIHAKRKRIKAGSGERMRKPGSEGAPTAADLKASQKEEVSLDGAFEQIDEISSDMAHRYLKGKRERDYDISADGKSSKLKKPQSFGKMNKDMKSTARALKAIEKAKKTNEEVEELDEISKATMGRYINKAKDSIDMASYRQGHKEAHGSSSKPLEKKLTKRHKGIETAVGKLTKEESEQIDELSKDTMGRYINKAATKMGSQGVTAGLKIAADEKSSKNFKDMGKREKGIKLAVNKLTKEEQDFIDSLNDADLEQIDELSKKTLGSYVKKASGAEQPKNVMSPKNVPLTKIAAYQGDSETGHFGKRFNQTTYDKAERLRKNRSQGITRAADKLAKEEVEIDEGVTNPEIKKTYADLLKTPGGSSERKAAIRRYKSLRQNAVKEEVELDEARGRPKKAGAKDFTIHPRTKEKLMHNNPEHMKRIERLQKNGILQKPKTEAGQNIMTQLQKAKTSMTGGSTIHFTHGDSKEVSGTHAARLLDKHAGMKPAEKETFQKKIGHSHENLKSEL